MFLSRGYEELAAEHAELSSNYFKEIEHLRRALSKLLDAGAKYMCLGLGSI